jgi:hypothetical protein
VFPDWAGIGRFFLIASVRQTKPGGWIEVVAAPAAVVRRQLISTGWVDVEEKPRIPGGWRVWIGALVRAVLNLGLGRFGGESVEKR